MGGRVDAGVGEGNQAGAGRVVAARAGATYHAPPMKPMNAEDHQPTTEAAAPRPIWSAVDVGVVTACVLLLVLIRLHAFPAPLETDECNYAYIGERLAEGGRLYEDVWDHQPPGVFALTAVVGGVFGFGPLAFKVLATVAAAITLVGVYVVCRMIFGQRSAWFAAALFAIAASDPGMAGEGCNREVYMNALGVWALAMVLRDRGWALVGAGVCLGLSSLLKTVTAAPWLFVLVAVVLTSQPRSAAGIGRRALALAIGPLVIWGATFGYFAATGRLTAFVDAAFIYNLDYGEVAAPLGRKLIGFFDAWLVFRSLLPLWCIGVVGYFALPWRNEPRIAAILTAFLLGNYLAASLPGKFWPHYYLLLFPSLVIGSAALYSWLPTAPRKVYAGGMFVMVLAGQFVFYLAQEPEALAAPRYGPRMVWARDIGRRVGEATALGDYVYINHIDVGVYYYGGRRCPTRYTLATHLIGETPTAAKRRSIFLAELQEHPPRLILLTPGLPFIPELDTFIRAQGYVMAGEDPGRLTVLCLPDRPIAPTDWRWRPPAALLPPDGGAP